MIWVKESVDKATCNFYKLAAIIAISFLFTFTACGRGAFTDYPIVVGEGTDFPLKGILSMPNDADGLVPGVVIVQGSGPQNMDGFMNLTLYRDIAEFLAANQIAAIRYDK